MKQYFCSFKCHGHNAAAAALGPQHQLRILLPFWASQHQLLLPWVPCTNWKYCYSPEPPNTSCCCPEPPAQAGNIVTVLGIPTPAAAALSPQHQLEILLLSWAIPNISCCCLTPAAAALDPWMWAGFEIYPFWGSCGRPIAIMAILIITVKWIQHPRTSHSKIDIIIRSYWFKMYAVSGIT